MKKSKLLMSFLLMALALVPAACNDEETTKNEYVAPLNQEAFRLSSIKDIADEDGVMAYKVYSPYTDTFQLKSTNVSSITVFKGEDELASSDNEINIDLVKDEVYTVKVVAEANADFSVTTKALNNLITYPYDTATPVEISSTSSSTDPLKAANIEYTKREGGTYIYSNNPEMIPNQAVNNAFIQDKNLTGDVFMTFEHANWTTSAMYLGYELKNETDHDVYITVTNIGYQTSGTWFGQLAWYKYYNTQFKLPDDYFQAPGVISKKYAHLDYAYQNYKTRVFQPTTYRLPAGEKFFVIGGTTKNTYNEINVDKTANEKVNPNACANGNVRFIVTGGSVTGTFYAYNNQKKLQEITEPLGYKVGGYAAQYCGIANHAGVIEANIGWEFNDNTKAQKLPVTYTNYYDNNVPNQTTPYKEYNNTAHLHENVTEWMTHLNPQNDHRAVGTDMVEFICTDEHGNKVIIDNYHADGNGNTANTANWMIEYQEHFTFTNSGNKERTIKVNYKDHGTLTMMVRDTKTGELIETYYTCGLGGDAVSYVYEVKVPANSSVQVSMCYSLVACSYGSVIHWVTLE